MTPAASKAPEGVPKAPRRKREKAVQLLLLGGPVSAEAKAFVDLLLQRTVIPAKVKATPEGKRKDPRPSSVEKMRQAAGALLADLVDLQAQGREGRRVPAGMHGASPNSFNKGRLGFAYGVFMDVRRPLEKAGLLKVRNGMPRWRKTFDNYVVRGGDVTTYRLTPKALALAEENGIRVEDWEVHWRRVGDRPPPATAGTPRLVLRSERKRIAGKKQDPIDLPVDHSSPEVRSILSSIDALNGFLASQQVGGLAFTGLRRIFNNGGDPAFAWNKGGRYYSLPGGHYYETMSADRRRSSIKLNGEAVEEVDLRASHLTLLHALLGQTFDATQDPYDVEGWPRPAVKLWVSQAIGASNPRPTQWSKTAQEAYEEECPGRFLSDEYPVREVGAAITARHPLLIDLKVCGIGTLDLQFHEAEILRRAMEDLMLTKGIPVLPMHDAIIAPTSKVHETREALLRAFSDHVEEVAGQPCKAIPKVTVKD